MYQELCGAKVNAITICDQRSKTETVIELSLSKLKAILGYTIPLDRCEQILISLGMTVKLTPESITAIVPSYRQVDIKDDVDLIEEIIRIEGYDKLPETLPVVNFTPKHTFREQFIGHIREQLLSYGLHELMTESLVPSKQPAEFMNSETRVTVANSHSEAHTDLRQSLIPNLLNVAEYNTSLSNPYCWGFELGRCYNIDKSKPTDPKTTQVNEALHLGICLTGVAESGVIGKPVIPDFYCLKGVIEAVMDAIGMKQTLKMEASKTHSYFHPGRCAVLKLGKQIIGILGQCHPAITEKGKLKHPLFLAELNLEILIPIAESKNRYDTFKPKALSVFPFVERDMAFVAPLEIHHYAIENTIQKLKHPLIQNIEVFDVYQGEQIETGHRSLAYRLTIGSLEKTLTDNEIESTVTDVKKQLEKELTVQFR